MRIVYGVSGEGAGHSSRAREIASHLTEQGHDLWLVSYDRGYQNLQGDFRVFETEGLTIASDENRVSIVKTFTDNLQRLPEGFEKFQAVRRQLFKEFQPECVITDFEPMTAHLANHYGIPLITIDNQHRMRYLEYECPPNLEFDSHVTRNIIRAMIPRPDVSLVTAFFSGTPRNERTFVFPPILRREVFAYQPCRDDFVLVYVTRQFDSLLPRLRELTRERFRVYGYDRGDVDGNLEFRPRSVEQFLRDLSTSKGVIATAGFTLISEALYFRKPYLGLPMQGQFEQELNAFQLAQMGYGKNVAEPTAESIGDFLYRLPDYEACLASYQAGDNTDIKAKLDQLLLEDGRLVREFHARRA